MKKSASFNNKNAIDKELSQIKIQLAALVDIDISKLYLKRLKNKEYLNYLISIFIKPQCISIFGSDKIDSCRSIELNKQPRNKTGQT